MIDDVRPIFVPTMDLITVVSLLERGGRKGPNILGENVLPRLITCNFLTYQIMPAEPPLGRPSIRPEIFFKVTSGYHTPLYAAIKSYIVHSILQVTDPHPSTDVGDIWRERRFESVLHARFDTDRCNVSRPCRP